jgi:hypothetical protein
MVELEEGLGYGESVRSQEVGESVFWDGAFVVVVP